MESSKTFPETKPTTSHLDQCPHVYTCALNRGTVSFSVAGRVLLILLTQCCEGALIFVFLPQCLFPLLLCSPPAGETS